MITPSDGITLRRCVECGDLLPLKHFPWNGELGKHVGNYCRSCKNEREYRRRKARACGRGSDRVALFRSLWLHSKQRDPLMRFCEALVVSAEATRAAVCAWRVQSDFDADRTTRGEL